MSFVCCAMGTFDMTGDRFQPPNARDEEGYTERREERELELADREHDRRREDCRDELLRLLKETKP